MKDHQDAMRSKANHQVQVAADDVTAEMTSISAMKHKLLDKEDVITPNKKPHKDIAKAASRHHQRQQKHEEANVTSASTSTSTTTPFTYFDPTEDPVRSALVGVIDIGPSFLRLQTEAAEVVNDLSKNMSLQLLPLFLSANFIWHLDYALPGLTETSSVAVHKALEVPLQQLPKDVVMLCHEFDQEMVTTGWIRSRTTETREQDELLILFQQICKKLPRKYASVNPQKNEDSHAHSSFDALMTSVFPGTDRHYQVHWANRKSKGSGERRGGDQLALKPDATITKDCYELGYVELKPPREDRNQRYFLEDVWALAGFAKDCIDSHLRHGRKITNVACLHVFGYQLTLYRLSFHDGIYVWQDISTAYLPRDHYDSGCTLRCLQLINTFKNILEDVNVEPYLRTPPRKEDDNSLSAELKPRPTHITPTKRPFFERSRPSSSSSR
ncbi:hypothetical protein EC968_000660 [Mortierella alpina]|nr:hypothetical protein EC968_000660 [Mortierella alpina]